MLQKSRSELTSADISYPCALMSDEFVQLVLGKIIMQRHRYSKGFSTSVEAKCCYHSSLHNIVVWSPTWSVSQPKNCDGTSIPSIVNNLLNLWNVNYKFQECWWFIWKNGACPWGTVLQKASRSSKLDNFQSLLVFHLQWQYYSSTCNSWKLITYCNLSTFRGN